MKQKTLISFLSIGVLCLSWCTLVPENTVQEEVNPASKYCEQNGWILEIVPDEWWSRWKCNFEDGSFCEEWAYYHWECSPGRWNGNTIEMEEIQDNEDISQEDKKEISEVVEEIEEINDTEKLEEQSTTCTADVKMCDDWTYVSRGWPNCEFWTCPGEKLSEDVIKEVLKKHENTWSELNEQDIDLMNEIIDIITE